MGGPVVASGLGNPCRPPLFEHRGFGGGHSRAPAFINPRAQGPGFDDDGDNSEEYYSDYSDDYSDDTYSDDQEMFGRGFGHAHPVGFNCPRSIGHGGCHMPARRETTRAAAPRLSGRFKVPSRGGRQSNLTQRTEHFGRAGDAGGTGRPVEIRGLSGREGAGLQAAGRRGAGRHGMRDMRGANAASAGIAQHPGFFGHANNDNGEDILNIPEGISGAGGAHRHGARNGNAPLTGRAGRSDRSRRADHVTNVGRANFEQGPNTTGLTSGGERLSRRRRRRRRRRGNTTAGNGNVPPVFEDISGGEEPSPRRMRRGRSSGLAHDHAGAEGGFSVPNLARLSLRSGRNRHPPVGFGSRG